MTGKKKTKKEELPTEPVADWRGVALRSGWLEPEVETLESVLAMSQHGEHRVVDVAGSSILLYSVVPYEFSGTDRDGARHGSVVTRTRWWRWHASRPVSVVHEAPGAREASERPWCPGHGLTCNPREANTCGILTRLVSWHWEPCDCPHVRIGDPKSHLDSCEAPRVSALREDERRLAVLVAEAEASLLGDPLDEKPGRKAERRQRPSKKSDWVLPGQSSFSLPAPGKTS